MFQLKMFNIPELYIVPKYGKKYDLNNKPVYLLTAQEWELEGFILREDSKPQAWLSSEKGWIPLYTSRYVVGKPEPVFHVAALQEMIDNLNCDIAKKKADIDTYIAQRNMAIEKKNMAHRQADIDFYQATLTFFVGLHIQAVDELRKLECDLSKLKA